MMTHIRARREAEARGRVQVALVPLAERHSLQAEAEALTNVTARDADVQRMLEWEAVASLVEALDQAEAATAPDTAALLDAIAEVDGVGAKTMDAIRDHLTDQGMI